MKKIFSILAITASFSVMMLSSCEKDGDLDPQEEGLTFEQVVAFDFDYLKNTAGDDGILNFYEVECVLNGDVSTMNTKDIRIVESTTIAAIGGYVYSIKTEYESMDWTKVVREGHWAGSFSIPDPTNRPVTFDEAVRILKEQKVCNVPSSDKCTFRHPMGGNMTLMYIFGSSTTKEYVGIDANTGEVIPL